MTCNKRHDQWINLDKFKTQKSTSTAHSSPSHYWEKISAMHKIFKMLSKFYSAKINLSICEYYSHFRENLFCVRLFVLDYMWIWFLKCRFISESRCHTQLTSRTRVIYHSCLVLGFYYYYYFLQWYHCFGATNQFSLKAIHQIKPYNTTWSGLFFLFCSLLFINTLRIHMQLLFVKHGDKCCITFLHIHEFIFLSKSYLVDMFNRL